LPVGTISDKSSAVIVAVWSGSMIDVTRYIQAYARMMKRIAMFDVVKKKRKKKDGKKKSCTTAKRIYKI